MSKRLVCLAAVSLLAIPPTSSASFRAAPERIVAAAGKIQPPPRGTLAKRAWVVCRVFREARCRSILNVAWCESGLRPWAVGPNDELGHPRLGLFQMGTRERLTYGHGRSTWDQARAAHRYWVLSHWGPWQCRPY